MKLAEWLAPRGLIFNEDKTRIVHVGRSGFDFLGFNVRRYHGKLLIKPSKAAIRRIRERLRTEIRSLRGSNARAVISALNLWVPRTVSRPLISAFPASRPRSNRPTAAQHDRPLGPHAPI